MSEPTPDPMARLACSILRSWRDGLQAEWERTSSVTNPRHDLARDIEALDAILSEHWQLSITPAQEVGTPMASLTDFPSIQHLLGDDAQLLLAGRNSRNETIVLVDTGSHREEAGRYVSWLVGHNNGCLRGHYGNDKSEAILATNERIFGHNLPGCAEQE